MRPSRCHLGLQAEKPNDFIFRNGFLAENRRAQRRVRGEESEAKKIALSSWTMTSADPFPQALPKGLKNWDHHPHQADYKFPGEKDFRPFLTRIKEGNPT